VITKAANSYAFLAAGQHMRLKCDLSIINNERNVDFWADADSAALEESTTWENTWLTFSLVSQLFLTWALALV